MTIVDALAAADWDIPPAEMEFAAPYAKLIQEVADLVASLAPAPLPEPIEPSSWQDKLAAATSLDRKSVV